MVFPKTIKTRFMPGPGVRGKNERSCVHRGLGSKAQTQYKVLQGWRREKWGSRNFDYSAFYLIFGTKRENNLQPTRAIV